MEKERKKKKTKDPLPHPEEFAKAVVSIKRSAADDFMFGEPTITIDTQDLSVILKAAKYAMKDKMAEWEEPELSEYDKWAMDRDWDKD